MLLTKSNYSTWAIKIKIYIKAQSVWEAVASDDPVEPRKNKMALATIYQEITEKTLL